LKAKPSCAAIGDFGLARSFLKASTLNLIESQKTINIQGLSPRYTAPEVFPLGWRMSEG